MNGDFDNLIIDYLRKSAELGVRQILVGGGAVNFHGYKRHSADLDFWIEMLPQNIETLISCLGQMGYETGSIPESVNLGEQNLSINISPVMTLELITRFNPNKTFEEAYQASVLAEFSHDEERITYRVLSYADLKVSKIKAGRPKDLLDITELERIRKV